MGTNVSEWQMKFQVPSCAVTQVRDKWQNMCREAEAQFSKFRRGPNRQEEDPLQQHCPPTAPPATVSPSSTTPLTVHVFDMHCSSFKSSVLGESKLRY